MFKGMIFIIIDFSDNFLFPGYSSVVNNSEILTNFRDGDLNEIR
jgi:hypothetical protein